MSRDLWGLMLAILAMVVAWLWASGRIDNVWKAMQGVGDNFADPNAPAATPAHAIEVANNLTIPQLVTPNLTTLNFNTPQPSSIPNYITTPGAVSPYVGGLGQMGPQN